MAFKSVEHYIKWSEDNRERNREYQRAYYAANKDRIRERQSKQRNNKSRLSSSEYKKMLISVLRQRDGDICSICKLTIGEGDFSVDHIIQRNMGGTSEAHNLRLAHKKCNHTAPRGHKIWNGKVIQNG